MDGAKQFRATKEVKKTKENADEEEWDRSIFNAHYLMRTPEQVAADAGKTHQQIGNKGYDEPLYAGSFWAPPTEDPEQPMRHGDYIHRLRRRRKWTMSR